MAKEAGIRRWQDVVNVWLEKHDRSRASLCREAELSETHFAHQMYGRKRIKDQALLRVEEAMGLEPNTLVDLKRVADAIGESGNE